MSGVGLAVIDSSDPNNKALLLTLLEESVKKCYTHDKSLITRGGMEQACVARIYYYMQRALEQDRRFELFSGYNLDNEYNKNGETPKTVIIENETRRVRPDIILHRRGDLSCDHNILVVEFKVWSNTNDTRDTVKLKEFTKQSNGYNYVLGVSVKLNKNDIRYTCFQNGDVSGEERLWSLD
jgi:hypothetical protein